MNRPIITRKWLDKRADLVNQTLGVIAGQNGSIVLEARYGAVQIDRYGWRGAHSHLFGGTKREVDTYLNGMLEGIRISAAHRQAMREAAIRADNQRMEAQTGMQPLDMMTFEACSFPGEAELHDKRRP